MDTKDIKLEANHLYQEVTPLLQQNPKYEDVLLADLAKVVLLCGRSNNNITANELLGFLVVYALIKRRKDILRPVLKQWDTSRDVRIHYEKETVKILQGLKNNFGAENQLALPYLLNQLDEEKGTRFLDKTTNAIYRFAQGVVKADGEITLEEMEALSQVWRLLHTYTPPQITPPQAQPTSGQSPISGQSVTSGQSAAFGQFASFDQFAAAVQSSTSIAGQPGQPEQAGQAGQGQTGAQVSSPPAATQATQASSPQPMTDEESLEEVLEELNQLIGMDNIKQEIRTLTNFLKVQKVRQDRGLARTSVSLHSVFSGPPGTGKTTVARLISRIFKALGFLGKGHLVETDRAGMVADYIGGTSKKVDEKVTTALDGVLFIDEAYALVPEDSARDFGQEAVDVLLKRMEDYRNRLVVIAAGYTTEMERFVESNPGLKSRFNRYFSFNDYMPDELVAIFNKMCRDSHFHPTEEANQTLKQLLTELYEQRDRTFGNARLVRNLFEKTIERQANRLAVINTLTDDILTTILPEDIPVEKGVKGKD